MVFDTPDGIAYYQLCALKSSLKLEIVTGMRRSSRGRTSYSIAKSRFGLRGNRERVLAQLQGLIEVSLRGPWRPCPGCEDYWCDLHGTHAHEDQCKCAPVEQWSRDPYWYRHGEDAPLSS